MSDTKRKLRAEIGLQTIPMVKRATGRIIPDLTGREHVCEWQSDVKVAPLKGEPNESSYISKTTEEKQ